MENNINELNIVKCIDILSDNIKNYGEGDVEFFTHKICEV